MKGDISANINITLNDLNTKELEKAALDKACNKLKSLLKQVPKK